MPPVMRRHGRNVLEVSRFSLSSLSLAPPGGAVPIIGVGEENGAFEHSAMLPMMAAAVKPLFPKTWPPSRKKTGFPTGNPA
ncbi:hypothetical protein [Chromobacterium violaceum]|uniref:hypothetical protein n=1 Tax=Chromobacterium violaceum TaxID=536 RepID=UPI00143DAEA0|nr:hypothetical protein [Chromobacterium violaceum]QIY80019.1 hypothetical protein FOB43_12875 [Chromobacterium violaceum]